MAGTVVTPAPVAGMDTGNVGNNACTASYVNSFRISAVADRLALYFRANPKNDAVEFFNLCLSLARGIDYAITNNEFPRRVQDLPILLKQVCKRKNDPLLQAAVMVLMISVKNACQNGWFSDTDSKELLSLANEIGSGFHSGSDINTEASSSISTISKIMSRFYPCMKMGPMLAFLEIKPGYGTFVTDFHISKDAKPSPEDKIRLFVAQTDDIETSSCIISPPQVNFLLNGKGVDRRTNVFMDTGPQVPTVVTHMLKYGTNLLQAVGQFNGNYIIIVAYMSVVTSPDCHALLDFVQPAVAAPDSDSEIIEGPSRISLNCPISFRRITTPVKGHSCKHLQCFDFYNYVDINSRRPSWRCPHCNQSVCYTDIHLDQNIVKVLKEVGDNVVDVIISADGSWKAVMETEDSTDQPHHRTLNSNLDGHVHQESSIIPNVPSDILDLTEENDEMDAVGPCENEDRKPFPANCPSQSNIENLTINPNTDHMNEINQNSCHVEDDFWSGLYLSACGSGASAALSDTQIVGRVSEPAPTPVMPSPLLTDAVSPALYRELEAFHGVATSLPHNQISIPNSLQFQEGQFGNSIISNGYGRSPSIGRHVSRIPITLQALPAQTSTLVNQQISRNSLNTLAHNGPSAQSSPAVSLIADSSNAASSNGGRQQQFSASHLNQLQVPHMTPSSLQQDVGVQNRDPQNRPRLPGQPGQQTVGRPASSQFPSSYRISSALPTEYQNSNHQLQLNMRVPQAPSQSTNLARSTAHSYARTQLHQGGTHSGIGQTTGVGDSQHTQLLFNAMQAVKMALGPPSMPAPFQTSRTSPSFPVSADRSRSAVGEQKRGNTGTVQPVTGADGSVDLPAEQNWRPTGRMRGSLSGQAYSAALSQYISQPTQPVQSARPSGVPPLVQTLMANNRNAHASQAVTHSSTETAFISGSSGVLSPHYSEMH